LRDRTGDFLYSPRQRIGQAALQVPNEYFAPIQNVRGAPGE
jgi:hypothetical protein